MATEDNHKLTTSWKTRLLVCGWLFFPFVAVAQWNIVTHQETGAVGETKIARVTNTDGYSLEIYRDSADAIRSRLTMANGLLNLADKSCPTFQIDKGMPQNRSINDAPCLSSSQWAEFILGYVEDGKVESSTLLGLMNGINITFRFVLKNGDYRQTSFSLSGSMRAMQTAFGRELVISATR